MPRTSDSDVTDATSVSVTDPSPAAPTFQPPAPADPPAETEAIEEPSDAPTPDFKVSLNPDSELESPVRVTVASFEPVEVSDSPVTVSAAHANALQGLPYLTVEAAE